MKASNLDSGDKTFPSLSNNLADFSLILTVSTVPLTFTFPPVNFNVPSCVTPCGAVDLLGLAFGLTGSIFGVYVVFTEVPFVSLIWTLTGFTFPL